MVLGSPLPTCRAISIVPFDLLSLSLSISPPIILNHLPLLASPFCCSLRLLFLLVFVLSRSIVSLRYDLSLSVKEIPNFGDFLSN